MNFPIKLAVLAVIYIYTLSYHVFYRIFETHHSYNWPRGTAATPRFVALRSSPGESERETSRRGLSAAALALHDIPWTPLKMECGKL